MRVCVSRDVVVGCYSDAAVQPSTRHVVVADRRRRRQVSDQENEVHLLRIVSQPLARPLAARAAVYIR